MSGDLRSEGTVYAVVQHVCPLRLLRSLFPSFTKRPLLQFLFLSLLSLHVAAAHLDSRVARQPSMPEVVLLLVVFFLFLLIFFVLLFVVAMHENCHVGGEESLFWGRQSGSGDGTTERGLSFLLFLDGHRSERVR